MSGSGRRSRTDMKPKPGEPILGELFEIPEGGDGDQSFLGKSQRTRLVEAAWFPGYVRFGAAMLFLVQDGLYADQFVALTSRSKAELIQQLTEFGWASVIVHLIRNPTASFDGSEIDADPIGMSSVVRPGTVV